MVLPTLQNLFVVLTIEERFFGKEDDARYPAYKLIAFNATTNETTEKEVETTEEESERE